MMMPPPLTYASRVSWPRNGATRTVTAAGLPSSTSPMPAAASQRSAVIDGVTSAANTHANTSPSHHVTRGRRGITLVTSRGGGGAGGSASLPRRGGWSSASGTGHILMSNSARVRPLLIDGNFMLRSTPFMQPYSAPLCLPLIFANTTRPLGPSMLM